MGHPTPFYCTEVEPGPKILRRVEQFRREVTQLPNLGLSEITSSDAFDDLWPSFVTNHRRWYELRILLRAGGWTTHRCRCLTYRDGKYKSVIQTRWTPPTESIEHFSPDPE